LYSQRPLILLCGELRATLVVATAIRAAISSLQRTILEKAFGLSASRDRETRLAAK
jgi:hypothetical protein